MVWSAAASGNALAAGLGAFVERLHNGGLRMRVSNRKRAPLGAQFEGRFKPSMARGQRAVRNACLRTTRVKEGGAVGVLLHFTLAPA